MTWQDKQCTLEVCGQSSRFVGANAFKQIGGNGKHSANQHCGMAWLRMYAPRNPACVKARSERRLHARMYFQLIFAKHSIVTTCQMNVAKRHPAFQNLGLLGLLALQSIVSLPVDHFNDWTYRTFRAVDSAWLHAGAARLCSRRLETWHLGTDVSILRSPKDG